MSDSSDSNSSFGYSYSTVFYDFNNYANVPEVHHDPPESPDIVGINNVPEFRMNLNSSSSSESDASLNETNSESSFSSDGFSYSTGRSSSLLQCLPKARVTANNTHEYKSWSIPRELYKREIGNYKSRVTWSNKFYRSEVVLKKLKLSKQLKGHRASVNSLDFNETGVFIVSGSNDYKIALWDWSRGKCLVKHNGAHSSNIFQTKFLTTQSDIRIVSSADDGLVILSAVNNYEVAFSKLIARHDRSCNKIAVNYEQPFTVLSCGEDGVVKNIDVRESTCINVDESRKNILHIKNSNGSSMPLYGIDINPMNLHEFIINGDDKYVRMYDKRKLTPNPIKMFCRLSTSNTVNNFNEEAADDVRDSRVAIPDIYFIKHVTSAVYNYCGTEILASYFDDDIYLFDVNDPPNTHLRRYCGHINKITDKSVTFYGPTSDYVASGSDCGYLFIWDKKSENLIQSKHADKMGNVGAFESHPHLPILATCGLDKTIKIWEPLNECRGPKTLNSKLKPDNSQSS